MGYLNSLVSNDGRGLKHDGRGGLRWPEPNSLVSNDGRGLKRGINMAAKANHVIRSSAMTGVD